MEFPPLTEDEIKAITDRMDVWSDYGPDPTRTILQLVATIEANKVKHEYWCDQTCDCGANEYVAPREKENKDGVSI